MTGILPIRYMSCHGIGVRHRRGAQPPRHPQLPALVRTVGRRDRARAGAGSAFRLEAPAGVAGRRVRRVADRGPAARLPAEARAPDGAGRLAVALPALLVEAPGCAGAAPGPDGRAVTEPFEEFTRREADTEEAKGEVMTTSETYAPGAAFGAHVEKDGDKWTLVHPVQVPLPRIQVLRPEAPEGRPPGVQLHQGLGPQLVNAPLGLDPRLDEPGVPQHPQVLRDGRLSQPQLALDLADRPFGREQEAEDGAAVGLRDDGERRFHDKTYT